MDIGSNKSSKVTPVASTKIPVQKKKIKIKGHEKILKKYSISFSLPDVMAAQRRQLQRRKNKKRKKKMMMTMMKSDSEIILSINFKINWTSI